MFKKKPIRFSSEVSSQEPREYENEEQPVKLTG